jgi:hypothetical protein
MRLLVVLRLFLYVLGDVHREYMQRVFVVHGNLGYRVQDALHEDVGDRNGLLHVGSCRPHMRAGCGDKKSERREMAAGEGTGMAGRPPLTANREPQMTEHLVL